jgi:DNA polymerase/3'-5' exonuclease PolX
MKLKGVGKKIGLKIDEIIQSGKLNKLDNAMADDNTVAVMELTRVYGIGPKFAKKLVDENKIMSVNDLQEAHKKKKVKLNHQQELGLKYFKEMEMKIPRAEVATYEELIFEKIRELDSTIIMTLCGSYRRGLEKSGDIDLLITQPKSSSKATEKYTTLKRVVDKLTKNKIITGMY